MSRFFYRVKNNQNKIMQSHIEASSITDAAIKLEKMGYIVIEIKEEERVNSYGMKTNLRMSGDLILTTTEKREFFNSFYFLFKSGLSVLAIFESMYNSSKNPKIKKLCSHILQKLEKGHSFKEAMKDLYQALGLAYSKLIAAGEETGKLESVLSDIIRNISKQEEIKSNLISSLTYPAIIFFLAVAVALLFKFFILRVFASMGSGLCYADILTMALTAVIKIIAVFGAIFGVLFYLYKNKKLLNKIIGFIVDIRIFQNIVKNYYFINFFLVLSLAYESGIPINEALVLANSVINIPAVNKKIKKAENMMNNGCELTTALRITGVFSNYAMSQISAGEKSGELDKMLKTVAFDYENKLDIAIKVMLKLIEPLTIIIVGIFVACIAVNAYRAYYSSLFSMF